MEKPVIDWDGEHLPEELSKLPPGRYTLEPVGAEPGLTAEEDKGISRALQEIEAGQGRSLNDVINEIRGRTPNA